MGVVTADTRSSVTTGTLVPSDSEQDAGRIAKEPFGAKKLRGR
jgi:hypothetical protein